MIVSEYFGGAYRSGFTCNICHRTGQNEPRWLCKRCTDDYCLECCPAMDSRPSCRRNHKMTSLTRSPNEYNGGPRCDECRSTNIHLDREFYHCSHCRYDLCVTCAPDFI